MTLSSTALTWIESQLGGRAINVVQQIRWRPHYFVTLDRGADTITVLARGQREPELVAKSPFLQHFSLAREAEVLQALQGHGLKVPKFLGYSDEHHLILMERVEGSNLLAEAPDDATRLRVMREYFEQLARLHNLEIDTIKLSTIGIPKTPEDIAFAGKFRFIEDGFTAMKPHMQPEPLLNLGVWWLHQNVPQGERSLRFLQGDTGPGQFMFENGHLTALIDWELAHIGDPMLDLGVVRMRNMLYPTGPLRESIAHYEKVLGRAIDWQALSFYTVLSMLLTPMGIADSIQRPTVALDTMMPRYGWYVTLRRGLCDALAEALKISVRPPEFPEPIATRAGAIAGHLTELLQAKCRPAANTDLERSQIDSALALAKSLHLETDVGAALLSDDLDDMAGVLGRRPPTREEGFALLDELVANDPRDVLIDFVKLFGRIERRREFLWKPLMVAQDSAPFEPLMPN